MSDIRRFASFDGQEIAYQVMGAGRPTLMIHGFLADAQINWIQPGIAEAVAVLGRQVILPDLRGHGRRQILRTGRWMRSPSIRRRWSRISGSATTTSSAIRWARGRPCG